jgi:hypothetical protein
MHSNMWQIIVFRKIISFKIRIKIYRVSIQFIDIMPLFRYIKELNYKIKVINSLSSFYYKFFEKITHKKLHTMQFLP